MMTIIKIKKIRSYIFFTVIIYFLTSCHVFYNKTTDPNEKRLKNAIQLNQKNELGYIRLAQYLEGKHRYPETLSILRLGQRQIPESITLIRLEGSLLQVLGKQKESVKFFTKQILKHPENELLYIDRAKIRWNMGKKYLALADARKALKINENSFDALFLIGVILSQKLDGNYENKFDDALKMLIAASEINDDDPDLWLRISLLWESKKNFHMAKLAMIKAVKLSPESEPFLQRLTLLFEKELAISLNENPSKISGSLKETLLHMLKLFPQNYWAHAHYGNWAWSQEKYSLAEKHLKKALKLNPVYAWAHFRLADVYISQNSWRYALLSLREGLKYAPKNDWALQKIGFSLEMLGENEKAIKHYESLIYVPPMKINLINRLSSLYWSEFLFKKGEEILLIGLKHFPLENSLIEKLVYYYESIGLYEKARNILTSFIKLEPRNSAAFAKIGFFEKKLNRPKSALDFFEKSLKISPDFEWALIQKIGILLKIKKFKLAENELNFFLKNHPNSEWALIELSKIKIKNEQFSIAEKILKKNLIRIKNSPLSLITLFELYNIQKRWEDAEKVLTQILKHDPNNSTFLKNLAYIQWKQNKIESAKLNVKKALYENLENILAWNLHFILLQKNEQKLWIGKDLKFVLPVLKNFFNQNYSKIWEEIKSVRIDPFTRQIMKNLYYLNQGHPEKIILEPEDMTSEHLTPWIHERWGVFHQILGNRELAAKHLEIVSKNLPYASWIDARLGLIYENLEKFDMSIDHYKKFLKRNPDAYEINFRLANVQMLLGNESSTIEIYEKIISERPNNSLVLNNLAWIFLTAKDKKLRNIKRGLELALRSVEISPNIDNLDTLAEGYFQSGDIKKALKIIRKAVNEVNYPIPRQPYLRKQLLRFKSGKPNTNPPSLS